jgi:hypothetical protein
MKANKVKEKYDFATLIRPLLIVGARSELNDSIT